jgi:hypothetical protein
MAKTHRIEGTFEENLWTLVKENANLDRFRELFELRTKPDLFCKDPIEKSSKESVFDYCLQHNQADIYSFLRRKLSGDDKKKVVEFPKA